MSQKSKKDVLASLISAVSGKVISIEKLFHVLSVSDQIPELRRQIGIFWMSEQEFAFNQEILAEVFGKSKWSIYKFFESRKEIFLIMSGHQPKEFRKWKICRSLSSYFSRSSNKSKIQQISQLFNFPIYLLEEFQIIGLSQKEQKNLYQWLSSKYLNIESPIIGLQRFIRWWKSMFKRDDAVKISASVFMILDGCFKVVSTSILSSLLNLMLNGNLEPFQDESIEVHFLDLFYKVFLFFGGENPLSFASPFLKEEHPLAFFFDFTHVMLIHFQMIQQPFLLTLNSEQICFEIIINQSDGSKHSFKIFIKHSLSSTGEINSSLSVVSENELINQQFESFEEIFQFLKLYIHNSFDQAQQKTEDATLIDIGSLYEDNDFEFFSLKFE